MMVWRRIFFCATLAFPFSPIAKDFYVAPGGSDGNPGSLAAPWKTLAKAADILQPGDICHIR